MPDGGAGLCPAHPCDVLGLPHLQACAPSPAERESQSDGYTLPWGVKIIPAESRPVGWLRKGSTFLPGTSCGGHSGSAFNLISHAAGPQEQRRQDQGQNQGRGALRLPSPCRPQHKLIPCPGAARSPPPSAGGVSSPPPAHVREWLPRAPPRAHVRALSAASHSAHSEADSETPRERGGSADPPPPPGRQGDSERQEWGKLWNIPAQLLHPSLTTLVPGVPGESRVSAAQKPKPPTQQNPPFSLFCRETSDHFRKPE